MNNRFYEQGLRFECVRCSRCCRHTPGYVFLSPADLARICEATGLTGPQALERFCRRVRPGGIPRVSLKEKQNLDCIFWEDGGCAIYSHRPFQCRSFPFWSSNLASREAWKRVAEDCPGVGRGSLHPAEEIRGWLTSRCEEGFL